MITWLLTTIGAVIAGCAGHYGQAYIARYVNLLKKKRALARIRQETYYSRGRIIASAISPGSGAVVCENYVIAELGVGRVLLIAMDRHAALPMTCMEFEELHVTIETDKYYDFDTNKVKNYE